MAARHLEFKLKTGGKNPPITITIHGESEYREDFTCIGDIPQGLAAEMRDPSTSLPAVTFLRALMQDPCPECNGSGHSRITRKKCESCGGEPSDDIARFDKMVNSKKILINEDDLTAICIGLLEEYAKRPFGSSPASATTSSPIGDSSTG